MTGQATGTKEMGAPAGRRSVARLTLHFRRLRGGRNGREVFDFLIAVMDGPTRPPAA